MRQWECFLVFGNFSLFKTPFPKQDSLPGTELPPCLFGLLFHLLYFFLPVFEDNELLFWVPDVLCQHSEVVLWSLLSVEMFFWCICGGESGLLVLFLSHLRNALPLSLFTFMHWRRKWQPTPVFLPAESQGRGSLVGCHLWSRTELDTTEVT